MTDKTKNKVVVFLFAAFLLTFVLLKVFMPSGDFSMTERRALKTLPKFTAENIFSGKISDAFEDYAADRFPMRDAFRRIKTFTAHNVLMQKDVDGYYMIDGYISKLMYPADYSSLDHATDVFGGVQELILKDAGCKVYLSIVPDKNYFLAGKNGLPAVDYDAFARYVAEKMPYATYLPLYENGESVLSISDYYKTDTHWRQEKIASVADLLAEGMGVKRTEVYTTNKLDVDFYGVYTGQAALSSQSEDLYYLTSPVLDDCRAEIFEDNVTKGVYDPEAAVYKENKPFDPYTFFLSGSKSLIKITNPDYQGEEKRLVVFRDSFGSSLIPLLCECYSEIYVVDLRYVPSYRMLQTYANNGMISFENADVLFLYSTLILNDSVQIN